MKTPEDFRQFYESDLRPVLEELDGRRRRIWRRFLAVLGVALALAVAAMAAAGAWHIPFLFVVGPMVAIAVLALSWHVLTRGFRAEFKRQVIGAVAGFVDPSLSYHPKRHISQRQFKGNRIFDHRIDRFGGEDYVAGKIEATAIEFSEVHAEYKTTSRSSKGGSRTTWHTIFKGLFIVADFNKHFRGMTVVLPDVAEKVLGWLGQKLQDMTDFLRPGELVKLEDPEFEREFVVYGDDQVEARYILSPSLMQRLLEFKRKTDRQVCFSFVQSNVCIAITTARNMFEPRWSRTLVDRALVQEYLRDLEFAVSIVDDLNLNTRIWTKE